jgi:hypothetical protein
MLQRFVEWLNSSLIELTMKKTKQTEIQKLDTDDTVLIDGCFTVDKHRWGTWTSLDTKGNKLVTSLTEEACINATRCYLKWQQDGFTENAQVYSGEVGGKL